MHMKRSMWTPMSPTTLLALCSLAGGELHAYMVGEQIAKYSEGIVAPNRSTVSRLLRRLVKRGWVSEHAPLPFPRSLRRQSYGLTPFGRRAMNHEIARLRNLFALISTKALA